MNIIDIMNSSSFLEPKCPGCSIKLEYGVNTIFNDTKSCHVCTSCGQNLK